LSLFQLESSQRFLKKKRLNNCIDVETKEDKRLVTEFAEIPCPMLKRPYILGPKGYKHEAILTLSGNGCGSNSIDMDSNGFHSHLFSSMLFSAEEEQ
jgi:hypothetical protein